MGFEIDLDGKAGIVTGAARGIGKGMAAALGKAGMAVTITDILEDTLDKTSAEFDALGITHLALIADGCMDSDVDNAVQKTAEKFGRIDMVINCAQGSVTNVPLEEQSVDDVM